MRRVLRLALPSGVIAGAATVTTYLIARTDTSATEIQQSTAAVVTLYARGDVGARRRRAAVRLVEAASMIAASIGAFCWALFLPIFFGRGFWQLDPGHPPTMLTGLGIAAVGVVAVEIVAWLVDRRRS